MSVTGPAMRVNTADFRAKTLHVWFLLGTPGAGKSLLLSHHAARTGEFVHATQASRGAASCHTAMHADSAHLSESGGDRPGGARAADGAGASELIRQAVWQSAGTADEYVTVELDDLCAHRRILRDITSQPDMAAAVRVGGITLCIDGLTGDWDLTNRPELPGAVAIADRVVITKSDLIDAERALALAKRVKRVNPTAPVLHGYHGDLGPARLLDSCMAQPEAGSFDIERWLAEAAFNRGGGPREFVCRMPPPGASSPDPGPTRHGWPDEIRAFFLTHDRPLDVSALTTFLKLFTADSNRRVLRVKGIARLAAHPDSPIVVHGIEHFLLPPMKLESWPTRDHRSRFAFVTRGVSRSWIESLLTNIDDQMTRDDGEPGERGSRPPYRGGRESLLDA